MVWLACGARRCISSTHRSTIDGVCSDVAVFHKRAVRASFITCNRKRPTTAGNIGSPASPANRATAPCPPPRLPQVLKLASRSASDDYLLSNPESVLAAVHFYRDVVTGDISFVLQTNTSAKSFKGIFQDPNFFVQARAASLPLLAP